MADQVREFMAAEQDARGRPLSPSEMARRIGDGVSRQNVEHLIAGGAEVPRYLAALARAMRTSADTLLAGQYRYAPAGAASSEPKPAPAAAAAPPWPFDDITPEVWASLTPKQRTIAEWAATRAIAEWAATRAAPPVGRVLGQNDSITHFPNDTPGDSQLGGIDDLPSNTTKRRGKR